MKIESPPQRTLYCNARVVDPSQDLDVLGGVLVEGSTIRDCGAHLARDNSATAEQVTNCHGLALVPGLVDMRLGSESWEDLAPTAFASGITSAALLPGNEPIVDTEAALDSVLLHARHPYAVKVYPYAAATRGLRGTTLTEYGLLARAGAIGVTDGIRAIGHSGIMLRVLQYAATHNLPVIQHPADPALCGGTATSGTLATRMGLSGIPREAEAILLERDIRLVAMTGARYHAALLSTAESLDIIRAAKARGLPVTCDTAPPYFALNELSISDYVTCARLFPPLRCEDDRRAVVTGLCDGTIDAVVSDHYRHKSDAKNISFAQAATGGAGLETLLSLTLDLVHQNMMPLLRALKLITSQPATLLGLQAGCLKPEYPADFMLLDLEKPWKYQEKLSPFSGRLLQGRVLKTVLDGKTVYASAH